MINKLSSPKVNPDFSSVDPGFNNVNLGFTYFNYCFKNVNPGFSNVNPDFHKAIPGFNNVNPGSTNVNSIFEKPILTLEKQVKITSNAELKLVINEPMVKPGLLLKKPRWRLEKP